MLRLLLPVLAGAGLIVLPTSSVWPEATDYALVMPGASASLLLDIDSAGDRLVAVGERGHILYSEDHGATWVQARVPTSVMLTRVFFVSPTTGWAVGHDGNILLSNDGGVNWSLQRDGVSDQARINEENVARAKDRVNTLRTRLDAAGEGGNEDLEAALEEALSSLDIAREILDEPVYAPPLMDVWFASEEQGWASGAYGVLLRTGNGGRTWDDWSYKVDNPDELHFNGVRGDARGTLYLASEWGYVFRSSTGGESWVETETGYDGSFFGVLVNSSTDSVFAYGLRGTIYRSTDGGDSWESLHSGSTYSFFGGASVDGDGLVFVGQNSAVVLTRDDGESFTTLTQDSRRGLTGVTTLPDGRIAVTGDGGSQLLPDVAGSGS